MFPFLFFYFFDQERSPKIILRASYDEINVSNFSCRFLNHNNFFQFELFQRRTQNHPWAEGPRMVLCPSGFINFALLKNLCTYQVISNITQGVVNFPKTCVKSSKPQGYFFWRQGNFFWRLGNIFCQQGNFFGSDQFLPSNELSNITYGVVNFPKTGGKSSKPQENFFC